MVEQFKGTWLEYLSLVVNIVQTIPVPPDGPVNENDLALVGAMKATMCTVCSCAVQKAKRLYAEGVEERARDN